MNGNRQFYFQNAYRELELALIGARESTRKHIEKAIEYLINYEKEQSLKKLK